jgi:hypothetical protein
MWATPTSGYGHVADEQPLPYVQRAGIELTPRFGGEETLAYCSSETVGLPHGILATSWPLKQRCFNLPRRAMNLYWRNILQSRTLPNRRFLFMHQLDFKPLPDGFIGHCPMVCFERRFIFESTGVRVEDMLIFRQNIRFSQFYPIVIPLFEEWSIDSVSPFRLEYTGFQLEQFGMQLSSAGTAILWVERIRDAVFVSGESLKRSYTYRWDPGT